MRKFLLYGISIAVVVIVTLACTFQVNEYEYAIVARFGDLRRPIQEPGLYFKWPPPIDDVLRIDRRVRVLDPDSAEYLTSDKKNVMVDCFVAWAVEDTRKFVRSVRDVRGADARLNDILASEIGTILGSYPLSALVSHQEQETTMSDINEEITTRTAAKAKENLGIRIEVARIKRLNFPRQNKQAVFRRMEAERQKIAKEIRAEGRKDSQKIRADANREAAVLISDAERQAAEIRGQGDAEATRIYAQAYETDPEFYEFLRLLDTYGKIFTENSTVVLPHDSDLLKALRGSEEEEGR
jgi:membrane protease subunit HflC